jgi:hypothetical protein
VPTFDADCPRRLSREAASIVETELLAAALTADVPLAANDACPLMPERSRYAAQEAAKTEVRHSLWRCGWCGKGFRSELLLDWHMHRAHAANDSGAPASGATYSQQLTGGVCLADFCGMLGCPSLPLDGVTPLPGDEGEVADSDGDEGDGDDEGEELAGEGEAQGGEGNELPTPGDEDGRAPAAGSDASGSGAAAGQPATAAAPAPSSHLRAGWANLAKGHVHPAVKPVKPGAGTKMSRAQQRERGRCLEVLASCFPLPPADAPASEERGEPEARGSGAGSDAAPADSSTYLRVPAPSARPPLRNRTLELRQRLAAEFCDTRAEDKVARRKQAGAVSAVAVVAYTFGGTAVLMGLLYVAILFCSDEEGVVTGVGGTRTRRLGRPGRRKAHDEFDDGDGGGGSGGPAQGYGQADSYRQRQMREDAAAVLRRRAAPPGRGGQPAGGAGGWESSDDDDGVGGAGRDAVPSPQVELARELAAGGRRPGGRGPSPDALRWLQQQRGRAHQHDHDDWEPGSDAAALALLAAEGRYDDPLAAADAHALRGDGRRW